MKNLYNKLFTITIALILASCSSNTEEAVVNEPASESIQEESNNETAADNLFYQVPTPNELFAVLKNSNVAYNSCLLYTSPSPRDGLLSRMPSSA